MIKVIFPIPDASISVNIEPWNNTESTRIYLITPEQSIYLGFDTIKNTQKRASGIKEKFSKYLSETLDDKYKELDLFGYSETQTVVTFVYKDLNPRIKFYIKNDISEYPVNTDTIKNLIKILDFLIKL